MNNVTDIRLERDFITNKDRIIIMFDGVTRCMADPTSSELQKMNIYDLENDNIICQIVIFSKK